MTGMTDNAEVSSSPIAAENRTFRRQLWAFPGAGTLRIGCNVAKCLLQERFIPQGGLFAELLFTPFENGDNITPCRIRDLEIKPGPLIRHESCRTPPRLKPLRQADE